MDARHSLDKRDKDPGALDEVEEVLKTAPQARDYSGAHEKTDPREIALDRNAIALARLNTIEKDLNLTGSQYQTCVSILFAGYVIVGIPANMVVTRVRPSIWMASCMTVWAIISGLTALSRNYTGLLLTRFFLGITEAPYYPGALYILARFYTRKELATRISILYTGNILATAFAGLIALGIFEMDGMERQLAHERTQRDTVGNAGESTSFSGIREAAKDPKVWLFVVMQHCHLGANGFKNFFPTAVKTLGFNQTITLVLTCPPYLIAGAISIAWSWSSGRHITIAKAVAVFGFILGCATLNTGARYFAMCVFSIGTYAVNSIILGWVSATCSQTKEKKACSLAIVNCIAVASFIWTPYMWPSSDEPRYTMAMSSSAALSVATALGAWGMRLWLMQENKKIRQSENESTLYYAY
ncbi:hypothetical protein BFJ68_g3436 [Fusarium oxysporum]|uniref:Transporter n=1 Tax=Fusarium oxysporum TaxID=5507 RepID=A0A420RQ31_FUSOX|nr:hypothetical protein BFJ68_g3436 [Fusarium oxysporum]